MVELEPLAYLKNASLLETVIVCVVMMWCARTIERMVVRVLSLDVRPIACSCKKS